MGTGGSNPPLSAKRRVSHRCAAILSYNDKRKVLTGNCERGNGKRVTRIVEGKRKMGTTQKSDTRVVEGKTKKKNNRV